MKNKNILLYNVSFGILLLMPPGWLVILIVIVLEVFFLSKYLKKKKFYAPITKSVLVANIISGIVGIYLSSKHNGGWWLVCWFPWVSRNEVRFGDLHNFILYFVIAVIGSIFIEIVVNLIFLKKRSSIKRIVRGTIVANLISNALVITIMYMLSFGL